MAAASIPPGSIEERNRWMLRARDAIDREYARPLNVPTLARIALASEAHFIRTFRATFGETPHRYLHGSLSGSGTTSNGAIAFVVSVTLLSLREQGVSG